MPCGRADGHAAHPYTHPEYGEVGCPGRAFDYPPGLASRVSGL